MPPDIRLPAAAVEALRQGRTIDAVRILRQATGLGLKDAHDHVEQYRRQHAYAGAASMADVDEDAPAPEGSFVFPPEAANAIARRDFREAIAHVRRANPGLDLRTAKAAIDDLRGARPGVKAAMPKAQRIPTVVEGDRGGQGGLLVFVFLALALGAWWLFSGAGS
jgi:hypothetical protein